MRLNDVRTSLLLMLAVMSVTSCTISDNGSKEFKGNFSSGWSFSTEDGASGLEASNETRTKVPQKLRAPMAAEKFESTGYPSSSKAALEQKYGPYASTFNGVALFDLGIKTEGAKRTVHAVAVNKDGFRKLQVVLEAPTPDKLGVEIVTSKKSQLKPFTTMTVSCPLDDAKVTADQIRVVSVER